ncbi:serine protease-like protein, partial [Leptotrombidium deliense]
GNFKYTTTGNGPDGTGVGPICLPEISSKDWDYKGQAKISGFGNTKHKGTAAEKLKFIEEKVLDDKLCERLYGRSNFPYDRKTMVCYGSLREGTATCQGDSGGPLVVLVKDHWIQKGIVSYGSACGAGGAPTVFARVKPYRPWIKKICGV